MDLAENGNCIATDVDNRGLVHDLLVEGLDWVGLHAVAHWNVEPHLHKADWRVVVLMELQGDLVLAGVALGHVGERYLEGRVMSNVEAQHGAGELGCAPVPALQAQLLLQHVLAVICTEEFGNFFLILKEFL